MLKANEKQFAVYCIFSTFVFSSFFDDFLVFFCKKVETWANPTKLRIVCMYECILLLLQMFYFFLLKFRFHLYGVFFAPMCMFIVHCFVFAASFFFVPHSKHTLVRLLSYIVCVLGCICSVLTLAARYTNNDSRN